LARVPPDRRWQAFCRGDQAAALSRNSITVLGLAYLCFGLAIVAPSNTAFVILYLAYGFLNFLGMAASIAETFGLGTIFYVSTAIFFLSLVVLRSGVRVQTS